MVIEIAYIMEKNDNLIIHVKKINMDLKQGATIFPKSHECIMETVMVYTQAFETRCKICGNCSLIDYSSMYPSIMKSYTNHKNRDPALGN